MEKKFQLSLKNKLKKRKKVIFLGGYGYGNVGDEAQLAADLDEFSTILNRYDLTVLTPNPDYTTLQHDGVRAEYASREAFFDESTSRLYSIKNKNKKSALHYIGNTFFKILFLIRMTLLLLNAYLIRLGVPTFFLSSKRVKLLDVIKDCDLVFFVGGGYLTGSTLSRLWDGMLVLKIASIFGKPVFLSGQTVGVWGNKLNKFIAKWGLKHAELITVRDPVDSYAALSEIGIEESRFSVCCDDALFCKCSSLENIPFDGFDLNADYIAFHFHYWGASEKKAKDKILDYAVCCLEKLKLKNKKIIVISMTKSDEESINDLKSRYHDDDLHYFEYNYDYELVRGVLANALYCITMKHHPIIFSLGECTPVITLNYSDYYEHKNRGALRLFGLEKYSVRIENESPDTLIDIVNEVEANYDSIVEGIADKLSEMKNERKQFFHEIEKYLK